MIDFAAWTKTLNKSSVDSNGVLEHSSQSTAFQLDGNGLILMSNSYGSLGKLLYVLGSQFAYIQNGNNKGT